MLVRLIKRYGSITRPLARAVLLLFLDRNYICGRHFDESYLGYLWAFRSIWQRNFLRLNAPLPWPAHLTCRISNPANISIDPDDLNVFQSPGTYFQNFAARIVIGKGSYVAPNVGIITANHDLSDLEAHTEGLDVILGRKCWIGMNSVVLPGVVLGDRTIVAAGSVVTESFPEGCVVIGGAPARVLRKL